MVLKTRQGKKEKALFSEFLSHFGKWRGKELEKKGEGEENLPQLDFRPKFWRLFFGGRRHPFSLCPRLFSCSLPFCLLFLKGKKGDKRGDFYLPPHFLACRRFHLPQMAASADAHRGATKKGKAMGENFYPTQAAFSLSPFSILAGRHANGALHSGERRGKRRAKSFWRKTT